ncbi:unnamed protein product, partial [Mesorhabditis belari]|uniref:Major facilitator superfamily (MFS) profile domain-containing protein n=1 Tax=Mesorhabditis belari TaxID=2138241 RepID=A0AAF3FPT1_9BILA
MVKIATENHDRNSDTSSTDKDPSKKHKIFPSSRFFTAILLCLCFVSLSVSTSNLGVSMTCMVKNTSAAEFDYDDTVFMSTNKTTAPRQKNACNEVGKTSCSERNKLAWTGMEKGFIDLNSKWAICASLILIILSNAMIPLVASTSVWLIFLFRVVTGMGDALLFPSATSLITRWFPPKERPFAIGFVTGGRQIGTLLIAPIAGQLCARSGSTFGGYEAIFNLSAIIGTFILVIWLFLSADKPSKQFCISETEKDYIERKIKEESLGKRNERGNPPWRKIAKCRALYVGVFALVGHEFPLVIMLQLLPMYIKDVLGFSEQQTGFISALPIGILWISKTLSSSLASVLTASKPPLLSKTTSCKIFNFIASLGLSVCIGVTPFIASPPWCIVLLCMANGFAGLHTPGVQTALVQIAPAYSGIITGISFSVVACFSIANKILSNSILDPQKANLDQWKIVFLISAVVAILPVFFFTIWGSAEREKWATNQGMNPDVETQSQSSNGSDNTLTRYAVAINQDLDLETA